jgi:hypothetical protein
MHTVEDLEKSLRRFNLLAALLGLSGTLGRLNATIDAINAAWSVKGIMANKDAAKDAKIAAAAQAWNLWTSRELVRGEGTLEQLRAHIATVNEWAKPPVPELEELLLERLHTRVQQLSRIDEALLDVDAISELRARVEKLERRRVVSPAPATAMAKDEHEGNGKPAVGP